MHCSGSREKTTTKRNGKWVERVDYLFAQPKLATMYTRLTYLVIVGVAIRSLCNVLEAVIVQLTEERAVPLVAEVPLADVLLEEDGELDAERPSVREPGDPAPVLLLLRQDVVDLLRERHRLDRDGGLVPRLGRYLGEVAVRVVDVVAGLGNDLDRLGFDGVVEALLLPPGPLPRCLLLLGMMATAIFYLLSLQPRSLPFLHLILGFGTFAPLLPCVVDRLAFLTELRLRTEQRRTAISR